MSSQPLRKAYQNLQNQLLINIKKSTIKQNAEDVKKRIALLTYQRINALRDSTPDSNTKIMEINRKIDTLKKSSNDPQVQIEEKLANGLKLQESERNDKHIDDIANYLSYQRTYQELIERYNPGLTMTQKDKIQKTAHKVGFELPKTVY
ncbi:hypothetical protein WICPIJ_004022 [Wickerhamomyces pijperi]|uniref:ATP synthase assembly factor FMC1, mitochondrial n=1 Tax=Wickerhamomyces pijperi TaxID=599730 RepID=A0A9P8Q8H1_WICPI|nr:hypothetical protein WICPIJ_004022 [Wickerhamomyces pijperi]